MFYIHFKLNRFLFIGYFCLLTLGLLPSAHAERPIRGFYTVPLSTENKHLEPFAQYPVKFKTRDYFKDPNTLSFPLPAALVGEEKIITMTKVTGTTNHWSGKHVESGACVRTPRELSCNLKFKDLNIDRTKVKTVIDQTYSPEEAPQRFLVAEIFGNEPLGIISYQLRGVENN